MAVVFVYQYMNVFMQKKIYKQSMSQLQCGKFSLSLEQPLLMGILNLTPDSFSDGGRFTNFDSALKQAKQMISDGADILDIGGESTRPGAKEVSVDQELERVIPLIESLASEIDVPISIDTSKATVMYEAVNAGASMINDVYALQQANALETAAKLDVPICLMHMQGVPRSMQKNVEYTDVIQEVLEFFYDRIEACCDIGIDQNNILIDPGFGFGKLLEHNIELLNKLSQFVKSGFPVLVGLSRKSMLGQITGKNVDARLASSLAVAQIAAQNGAHIIRAHDVAETKDMLRILQALSLN